MHLHRGTKSRYGFFTRLLFLMDPRSKPDSSFKYHCVTEIKRKNSVTFLGGRKKSLTYRYSFFGAGEEGKRELQYFKYRSVFAAFTVFIFFIASLFIYFPIFKGGGLLSGEHNLKQ